MSVQANALTHSLTLAALFALTACGGGGSSDTAATPAPAPAVTAPTPATAATVLNVTAANAKALSAHALDTTQNAFNVFGVLGFVVVGGVPSTSTIPKICPYGGLSVLTGGVANVNLLTQGDTYNSAYTNCAVASVRGINMTLNGNSAVTVSRGGSTNLPFNLGFSAKLNNLRIEAAGWTWLLNGDEQFDWTARSTAVQTHTISGASLSSQSANAGVIRNTLWQNYSQTSEMSATNTSYALRATVQTDNPNVGAVGGTYTVSTPTPILHSSTTGLRSAGVVKILGAANSQILATVGTGNVVTLQVDANGDGVFESTISTTFAELATFL